VKLSFSLSFDRGADYTLVAASWEPGPSAMAASGAALAIGFLRRDTRPSLKSLWDAVLATGRTMVDMLLMCAAAGVIIGALQVSGIGFNFSNILLGMGGESLLAILALTGFVSFVLGIPLPTAVITPCSPYWLPPRGAAGRRAGRAPVPFLHGMLSRRRRIVGICASALPARPVKTDTTPCASA
jgi:TRAP-type C4-dicarboxylate transport system permease large subunit